MPSLYPHHNPDDTYGTIAVFGGVYNNYLALERLVEETRGLEVDATYCLGDIGGFGTLPERRRAQMPVRR